MGTETILIVLLSFMILGGLVALETPALISSVISLGAVGIGLSIAFLFLSAPDLAIVQVAVEVVALIFLIRATISREVMPTRGHIRGAAIAFCVALLAVFLGIGILAVRGLPPFGMPVFSRMAQAPSNRYLQETLQDTGAANAVTSIVLDYRGYDTMGEATVLFAAVLGALTILRGRSKREKDK
jgi:multicomponent Na+:H+ antiporter subunit B